MFQEEGQGLLLALDIGLDGLHLLVVQMAVAVAVAVVGDVERGDEVVADFALAVEPRCSGRCPSQDIPCAGR